MCALSDTYENVRAMAFSVLNSIANRRNDLFSMRFVEGVIDC